jgi:hypothetical protein
VAGSSATVASVAVFHIVIRLGTAVRGLSSGRGVGTAIGSLGGSGLGTTVRGLSCSGGCSSGGGGVGTILGGSSWQGSRRRVGSDRSICGASAGCGGVGHNESSEQCNYEENLWVEHGVYGCVGLKCGVIIAMWI